MITNLLPTVRPTLSATQEFAGFWASLPATQRAAWTAIGQSVPPVPEVVATDDDIRAALAVFAASF